MGDKVCLCQGDVWLRWMRRFLLPGWIQLLTPFTMRQYYLVDDPPFKKNERGVFNCGVSKLKRGDGFVQGKYQSRSDRIVSYILTNCPKLAQIQSYQHRE